MSRENGNTKWIQRGRQRAAVARVLRKPKTTSEICEAARVFSPHVQLRDIWLILKEMSAKRLVVCLNPRHVTGKLYALTDRGRRAVRQAFGIEVPRIPKGVDWRKYARVVRAKVRRLVLIEVARLSASRPVTATEVKRSLRDKHPLGLNPTIRALEELESIGVIKPSRRESDACPRTFTLTAGGKRLADQIVR